MKGLSVLYTVLITAAVLAGTFAIVALYRSGSQSVPGLQAFVVPGPLSTSHAFMEGDCEECHTPVRGVEAKTCITCHATAAADLASQRTAFHAGIQDCRGCHVEHEGAARPIRMSHAALVRIGSHLATEGRSKPALPRQIADELAAYFGTEFSATAEKDALNCASCHSNEDRHRELFGRDCAGCHETASWQISAFLHPSSTSRDCAECHQAPPSHYMEHFGMVSMRVAGQPLAQVKQCYVCHQTNSFNDIKGVGWYQHH